MKAYLKRIISPKVLILLISIVLFSVLTGCGGSTSSSTSNQKPDQQESEQQTKLFNFFDKVSLGMTKEQIDSTLGVAPIPNSGGIEGMFDYMDKNGKYGVLVTYNDKDIAYSKTLIYNEGHAILTSFTAKPVKKGQVDSIISKSLTYQQVTDLLGGEGVLCSLGGLPNDFSKPSEIRRWANKDGSCIQVVFSQEGNVANALFYEAD